MPDFDPYHKWLGISPQHQPPNHYRLLSLDLYESDPDVIEASVDRIAAFLQDVATGPQAKESQQLLNEIATARLCLLDDAKRSAYDAKLKTELAEANPPNEDKQAPIPAPTVAFSIDTGETTVASSTATPKRIPKRPTQQTKSKKTQSQKQTSPLLLLSFVSGGVLLIAVVWFSFFRGDSEARRRAAEQEHRRERAASFAEMAQEAESMIPDFEANFDAEVEPQKTRRKRTSNK